MSETSNMVQRFHFDLTNGSSTVPDEDGVEACDLDQAIGQASAVIEEMRESGELTDADEGWRLIVRDGNGAILKTIPLH